METGTSKPIALEIQEAKEAFEAQIERAVSAYEPGHGGAFSIDVNLEEEREEDEHAALRQQLRMLTDAFHANTAVRQSGVRARHLTAIDSDGDGEVAVKVKYDYSV